MNLIEVSFLQTVYYITNIRRCGIGANETALQQSQNLLKLTITVMTKSMSIGCFCLRSVINWNSYGENFWREGIIENRSSSKMCAILTVAREMTGK